MIINSVKEVIELPKKTVTQKTTVMSTYAKPAGKGSKKTKKY